MCVRQCILGVYVCVCMRVSERGVKYGDSYRNASAHFCVWMFVCLCVCVCMISWSVIMVNWGWIA